MSLLVCATGILPERETDHDLPFEVSDFGNISEKASDLNPIQSERHVDVVLEWKGRESILIVSVSTCAPIS